MDRERLNHLMQDPSSVQRSDIADLNNISSQRGGGAIVAGLFMRDFTAGIPWAHLDIAGTAWTTKTQPYHPVGATGAGVRVVTEYLAGR